MQAANGSCKRRLFCVALVCMAILVLVLPMRAYAEAGSASQVGEDAVFSDDGVVISLPDYSVKLPGVAADTYKVEYRATGATEDVEGATGVYALKGATRVLSVYLDAQQSTTPDFEVFCFEESVVSELGASGTDWLNTGVMTSDGLHVAVRLISTDEAGVSEVESLGEATDADGLAELRASLNLVDIAAWVVGSDDASGDASHGTAATTPGVTLAVADDGAATVTVPDYVLTVPTSYLRQNGALDFSYSSFGYRAKAEEAVGQGSGFYSSMLYLYPEGIDSGDWYAHAIVAVRTEAEPAADGPYARCLLEGQTTDGMKVEALAAYNAWAEDADAQYAAAEERAAGLGQGVTLR